MIPDETVSLVRERVDIVEVIGEFVELRRAGSNYKGLCPFHQEKTPSFNVNQARQMFHCFGCGVGGDVFTFVMNYEGRTFTDTLRTLAGRVGVEIEEQRESKELRRARARRQEERERLLEVMESAVVFYREVLSSKRGEVARQYLAQREIPSSAVEEFGLGYAPAEWDALTSRLKALSVSPLEAERVGLVVARKSGDGFYDRFRDRIIFPVHDAAGRTVALGGRVLPGAPEDAPKYVNSPESPIFSKSRTLYGLFRAREALRRREPPVVVEGNLDVLAMHAHGFVATVAPMGTALTAEQVGLLRRYGDRAGTVTLLFDGDDAGRKAALRAQPALAEGGLGARVALMPPTEDPDSFLRRRGASALAELFKSATGLVEHLIDEAARQAGTDAHSKTKAIRELAPVISTVTDPMERDLYRRRVARVFGVEEAVVFRHLKGEPSRPSAPEHTERPDGRRLAEGSVIGALLDHPALMDEAVELGARELVADGSARQMLGQLELVAAGQMTIEELIEEAPDERVAKKIRARVVEPRHEELEDARRALRESLAKLKGLSERSDTDRLQEEIKQAELAGDTERASRLAQEKLLRRKRAAEDLPGGASGR